MPLYDRVAAAYDVTRGWPPAVAAAIGAGLYARLAPYARPGARLSVLEAGAGTGRVLAPLAARGAWAVGVDVSPGMLRVQQAKQPPPGPGALYAVLADARRLPFADGRFDVGLLVHVLHLVGDWPPVLAETLRVVRSAGCLVLGLDETAADEESWIESSWAELVAAAGGEAGAGAGNRRTGVTAAARAALAAQGYRIEDRVLARWTEESTPAQILDCYRLRCFSASWNLPDTVLAAALARLRPLLLDRYGRLDRPLVRARTFRVLLAHRDLA